MKKFFIWFFGVLVGVYVIGAVISAVVGEKKEAPSASAPAELLTEREGRLTLTKDMNRYKAVTNAKGITALIVIDPLQADDGNMQAVVLSAIKEIYPNDSGWMGAKLVAHKLPNGSNAVAIVGDQYRYIALPVWDDSESKVIQRLSFWREKI